MVNYGYVDDGDGSLQAKEGGKFGLNKGNLIKFEYNANAGKDESEADAIDITYKVGDREYRSRIYDVVGEVYHKGEKIDSEHDNYNEEVESQMKQIQAVMTHVLKSVGVTAETIQSALNAPINGFADWAKIMTGLTEKGFETKDVDIFLEWQWTIPEGKQMTYLTVPKNLKGGRFLCPHQTAKGSWKEVINQEEGLSYTDNDNNVHPFNKSTNFLESNKGFQQREDQEDVTLLDKHNETTSQNNEASDANSSPTW